MYQIALPSKRTPQEKWTIQMTAIVSNIDANYLEGRQYIAPRLDIDWKSRLR
jgi:hypothetical protein